MSNTTAMTSRVAAALAGIVLAGTSATAANAADIPASPPPVSITTRPVVCSFGWWGQCHQWRRVETFSHSQIAGEAGAWRTVTLHERRTGSCAAMLGSWTVVSAS